MKMKRILAVLLALVMALGTTALAADSFTDVAEDAYFADAVAWAAEQKITNGRGNGIFDPDATVNRAEAVTFLWRMAGEPEPTQTETFGDVEADANNAWYKTAVQWAVEERITNGTGNGNFSPTVTCSRGMILTMLYRMEGCPFDEAAQAVVPEDSESWTLEDLGNAMVQSFIEGFRSENGFTDVQQGAYYELPIFWAAVNQVLDENQIDSETMAAGPAEPCPRGEMVYFLHGAAEYEAAAKAAEEANKPVEPIAVGTVPETVALNQDGVKLTVTGIEADERGEARLKLRFENGSKQKLSADVSSLFVNTFYVSPSTFIPIVEDHVTFYENTIIAAAGETKDFYVGLNDLREKGITAVYEIELQMYASAVTEIEDGYEFEEYTSGEPVKIRTSLYDANVSYDLDGTTVSDRDGLTVRVCKAENNRYMGPQIAVYAYNRGSQDVSLELAELKLDGVKYEASFNLYIPAGRRNVETVYLDLDYDNIPVVKEAELTLRTLDQETWEPKATFDPVKVAFAD